MSTPMQQLTGHQLRDSRDGEVRVWVLYPGQKRFVVEIDSLGIGEVIRP